MTSIATPPSAKPIIRLRGVHKSFGSLRVLRGVDMDFLQGQTTVVIGPSGCGKSVLLKHIVGLLQPDRGEVYFDEHRIDTLREPRLVPIRTQFGFLFQMAALFDSMTVEQNVCFPLAEHSPMTAAQRRQRCEQVLAMVGMENTGPKFPAELSGGQKKRVALARAIALHPRVILYDEPTTGLDPIRADVINELILKLQRELHATSIVVTHDMASAEKIADRIVMLYDGRIIFDDTPQAIRRADNPLVKAFVEGRSDLQKLDGLEANGSDLLKT
jgi:phospholipid/cholesterol/gamma-HCH transport system ATP-binding protein